MNERSTIECLRYSFHVIFHPFDGFWDLKHEHRGNLKAALWIIGFLLILTVLKSQLTSFLVTDIRSENVNILTEILRILVPFILWCISNWCITTLMDGEGNFRDIVITTAYAMVPYALIGLPLIIFSRVITNDEAVFYYLIYWVSVGWSAFLLFNGIMTVHQFTVGKTLATVIIAIIGMAVIVFLCVLFVAVIQQLIGVITVIYKELSLRR